MKGEEGCLAYARGHDRQGRLLAAAPVTKVGARRAWLTGVPVIVVIWGSPIQLRAKPNCGGGERPPHEVTNGKGAQTEHASRNPAPGRLRPPPAAPCSPLPPPAALCRALAPPAVVASRRRA